jgi:predicted site-specific integrase-resolvase
MKETKDDKQLFSEKEAADYFGWSVFTMRDIRKRGEIPHLIFNNKTVRYTAEQLENYKDEHLNGGANSDDNQ